MAFQTGTANDYVDLLNKLITFVTSNGVTAASVAAGGTGYTVGDILTATGGTFSVAATFRVKTAPAGVVGSVVPVQSGGYTVNPGNPVSTTGGTGTGCTLTLTFAATGWALSRQSQEAVSAAVQAGGTGYAVNDIVTAVGGTLVQAAQFKVTGVSGGAITTLALWTRGNYQIIPANPVSLTGGTGTGGTINITWQGVTPNTNKEVNSATISAGGTGYTVADILTLSGGTFGTAGQFRVTTVSGGVVTGVTPHTRGDYTATPSNPAATTGGTGTGCTLTVTYVDKQPNPDKEALLEGVGSGSDEVYVGIRTFNDAGGSGARNWELAGMTGYQAAATFSTQPGLSPGRWDGVGAAQEGAYMPLANSSLTYWFVVNGRRIIVVAKIGSTYTNAYLGWMNPFGTTTQYAYPMAIIGCSSLWNRLSTAAVVEFSGMVDPVSHGTASVGPGLVRDPGGSWKGVANSGGAGSNRVERGDRNIFPCGSGSLTGLLNGADDPAVSGAGFDAYDMVPGVGSPGTPTLRLHQITDTPSDKSTLWPTFVVERSPVIQALGELADVFWISAVGTSGNLAAEDFIMIGDDTYRIFHNCNRTDLHAHWALREA